MNCVDEIKKELNVWMGLKKSGGPLSKNRNDANQVGHC
jgi:hypothetical protein